MSGSEVWHVLALVVGWSYAILWTISFGFQTWHNFRRKSVIGFSFSYLTLNLIGFTYYSIYNLMLRFSKPVQDVFNEGSNDDGSPVDYSDVFFSVSAWALTAIQVVQVFVYPKGAQIFSPVTLLIDSSLLVTIIVTLILCGSDVAKHLWVLEMMGVVKMISTVLKFTPQVFLNFKRKNTGGWSIRNVTTDWTGGVLALFAMVLTCMYNGKWKQQFSNYPKIGLSVESIAFDTIFVFQHYVVYRKNNKILWRQQKEEKLLASKAIVGNPNPMNAGINDNDDIVSTKAAMNSLRSIADAEIEIETTALLGSDDDESVHSD